VVGRSAAFFDLDRTVLPRSSSPEFHAALADAGLVPRRELPGAGLLGFAYDHFGESLAVMALARAAALTSRGWPVDRVDAAAEAAAARLETRVAPYVRPLLAEHRRDGVLTVLVTTSPEHFVRPLADRLGFDDLLATRYEIRDGKFTGSLDGPFVWSLGKLAVVRRWAEANDIALADSYAYSDSVYDLPLLSAVGHPSAVNPDPRLRVVATARRWPLRWLDVPPGVPKLAGLEPFDVLRFLSRPELMPWVRFDIAGVSRIPATGPGIVVANHRSYFDTAAIGMTLMRAGRPVRFLGKKEVFDAPVIGALASALGGIRVDRGSGQGSPLREAERALAAGELVALMPQGTIPRGRAFFEPVLTGRSGTARLVAATGAPVIPIGLWGTERVWPRSSRLPNLTQLHPPPTVRVRVGRPVAGLGQDLATDTETIMAAISALLPADARRRHTPTPEELARTYPAGRVGEERG
jgi:putative phosphoserine phosphatase/1-acylglycerol-3-phosphate O-acyltransferase